LSPFRPIPLFAKLHFADTQGGDHPKRGWVTVLGAKGRRRRVGRHARWLLVVTVLAGLVASSCAVPPTSGQGPADFVAPATRDVMGVAYGSDPAQLLDLHLPSGPGPYPVVVYLHSGGWLGGSRANIPEFLRYQVARRGIALVSVDYRLSGFAPDGSPSNAFPVPDQDVDQAIRFVRARAATWNLDPAMIIIAGASAGGHLALLAAAAPGRFVSPDLPADLRAVSPAVQGVMDFVGPSDLDWLLHNGISYAPFITAVYLGCPQGRADLCSDALAQSASPQSYVHVGIPPGYFAYGYYDGLVPAGPQGVAIALPWALARNDFAIEPIFVRGTYLEIAQAGHNLDMSNFAYRSMQVWLDYTIAGVFK